MYCVLQNAEDMYKLVEDMWEDEDSLSTMMVIHTRGISLNLSYLRATSASSSREKSDRL